MITLSCPIYAIEEFGQAVQLPTDAIVRMAPFAVDKIVTGAITVIVDVDKDSGLDGIFYVDAAALGFA
jgi:hypothetical protein